MKLYIHVKKLYIQTCILYELGILCCYELFNYGPV